MLFGVHWGILLQRAVKPAASPDEIADVVEVAFVLVVAPPREVSVLRRHQLKVDPLGCEAPGAVPPCEVEGASHRPLHQDVAGVILVLAETRHSVIFATTQFDAVAIVHVVKHPQRAARHHLQRPELLPEKAIQRLHTQRKEYRRIAKRMRYCSITTFILPLILHGEKKKKNLNFM